MYSITGLRHLTHNGVSSTLSTNLLQRGSCVAEVKKVVFGLLL